MLILLINLGDNPFFQLTIGLCMLFFCFVHCNQPNPVALIPAQLDKVPQTSPDVVKRGQLDSEQPKQNERNHPAPLKETGANTLNGANPANSGKSSLTLKTVTDNPGIEEWELVADRIKRKKQNNVVD